MEEIGNTSLTRKEYTDKVNRWVSQNPGEFEKIRTATNNKPWPEVQRRLEPELGKAYWTEVKGDRKATGLVPGEGEAGYNFRLENKGKNKGGFKSFETRKETRGSEFRRAATNQQTLSLEDYFAYADMSEGKFSREFAQSLFNTNQNKLRLLRRHKGTKLPSGPLIAYEHLIPTTSTTYGGVEHWRNILLMDEPSNLKKSDFMISKEAAINAGIPLSKEDALRMDFEGDKALPPKVKRKIVQEDLTTRTPDRARDLRNNGTNSNGNSNGKVNGKVNGKSNGSGLALNAKDFKVGKLRLADQAVNVGINLGTGNYVGAAIGGGTIAMTETLKSKAAQKAIARQIATIAAQRGGKSALKLIPGLDILLSGKESWDYLAQGKLDQAGIAALSGAIGWIPVIGDGASAALDFTNTGIDLARLDVPNRTKKTKAKNKSTRLLKHIKI